jgi:hypothetical protein
VNGEGWSSLDERRGSALEALCETIVPGSGRVKPAVYIDAKLALADDGTRGVALAAIDSLASIADAGPEALRERVATPEFLMVRALAIEAFYSDFVAPNGVGPTAWEEIGFQFPLATRIKHDWCYLGLPESHGVGGPG